MTLSPEDLTQLRGKYVGGSAQVFRSHLQQAETNLRKRGVILPAETPERDLLRREHEAFEAGNADLLEMLHLERKQLLGYDGENT